MDETYEIPLDEKKIYQVWSISSVRFTWFVAELDENGKTGFGYANLNNNRDAEWGYLNMDEIKDSGGELISTKVQSFKEAIKEFIPSLAVENTAEITN